MASLLVRSIPALGRAWAKCPQPSFPVLRSRENKNGQPGQLYESGSSSSSRAARKVRNWNREAVARKRNEKAFLQSPQVLPKQHPQELCAPSGFEFWSGTMLRLQVLLWTCDSALDLGLGVTSRKACCAPGGGHAPSDCAICWSQAHTDAADSGSLLVYNEAAAPPPGKRQETVFLPSIEPWPPGSGQLEMHSNAAMGQFAKSRAGLFGSAHFCHGAHASLMAP